MGKSADTPQSPDPAKIIPLQGAENRRTFDYTTSQSRVNTNNPYGTSTWDRTPQFDEAGYNSALAQWNAGNKQGTWVPPTEETRTVSEGGDQVVPARAGYWEGASGTNAPMPSKDDFTRYSWTNNQTFNPREQGIFDANRDTASQIAGQLGGLTQRYTDSLSHGPDYSKVIGQSGPLSTYNYDTLRSLGMISSEMDSGKLPTFGTMGDNYKLGQVRSGDINRSGIDMSYKGVNAPNAVVQDRSGQVGSNVNNWAGMFLPGAADTMGRMSDMNPWAFDQQGADASYDIAMRYLKPQQEQDQKAIEARLAEQGFVPGTPAYNQAMQTFQDTNNRAAADARDKALLAGREYGNQAYDNQAGTLNDLLSGMVNYGKFGVSNDQARDTSQLDSAKFGLLNDQARSTEGLDIAKFLSGEAQFGANYGLKAQGQDFDQQKVLSDQARTRGLDANAVIESQFGLDSKRLDFNNTTAQREYQNYADLTKANNDYRGQNFDRGRQTEENNRLAIEQNNKTRAAQIAEADAAQNLPLQQLLTALGLAKPGEIPGSTTAQTGNMSPVDIAGLFQNQYNGQVAGANAETSTNNANTGAIAGLLASTASQWGPWLAGILSDRRLKENIVRIGKSPKGYPWYSFNYIGDPTPREGVMAQEVLPHDPSAVLVHKSGFYMVDYSKV